MAIKAQIYYYNIGLDATSANPIFQGSITLGSPFSIFTGDRPYNYKVSPTTKSNEFIVIEEYSGPPTYFHVGADGAVSPPIGGLFRGLTTTNSLSGLRAYIQFRVNNTDYFKDPDGVPRDGMPANLRPFPRQQYAYTCVERQVPVYILPDQRWDCLFTIYNDDLTGDLPVTTPTPNTAFLLKYTLYDGPDAIVAMKLLDMGLQVTPANADWFKKKLIGMAPVGSIPDAPKPAQGYNEDTLGEDQSGNDIKY